MLEWSSWISNTGKILDNAEFLKGRFTISRNHKKNMLYLQINSLRAKDIAMYSRAKDTMKELQDEQNILEFPY
jgi:hypothetical protein